MAIRARGLARERHTGIKAVAAATAVGGFVAAWLGFMNSHGSTGTDDSSQVLALASTLESTALPTATATATSTASAGGSSVPAAEPTATPSTQPTTVPRSRISRGS